MDILYAARVSRWERLRTINRLAQYMTKLSQVCGAKLNRRIAFMTSAKIGAVRSYVNGPSHPCVAVFCVADLAGDFATSKSASGGYVTIVGSTSWANIADICIRHHTVSHSSTESEFFAFDFASDTGAWVKAMPCYTAFGAERRRRAPEDNDFVINITLKKRSMALRHVLRLHRVATGWLFGALATASPCGISPHMHNSQIYKKPEFAVQTYGWCCSMCGRCMA